MSLTIDDIRDAGFLSVEAYDDDGRYAWDKLSGSGWRHVSPTNLGIDPRFVDSLGYFSVRSSYPAVDAQALLAFDDSTRTLAIAFRGTSSLTDWFIDICVSNVPCFERGR